MLRVRLARLSGGPLGGRRFGVNPTAAKTARFDDSTTSCIMWDMPELPSETKIASNKQERNNLEIEKLRLEVRHLAAPWWKGPSHIAASVVSQ